MYNIKNEAEPWVIMRQYKFAKCNKQATLYRTC